MAKSLAQWNRPLIYYTVSGLVAGAGIGIVYANLFPLKFGHGYCHFFWHSEFLDLA